MILLEARNIQHSVQDRLLFDIDEITIYKNDRIGLIGHNGCGKTTLLNVLSGKATPSKGHVVQHVETDFLPQLKRNDPTKSGGEVTQQYITDVFARGKDLLFADEPTTHLDREHMEWLEKKLAQWPGAYVIVSHDRAFLDATCTTIWELDAGKLKPYKGNYCDYEVQKEKEFKSQMGEYEKYETKKRQLEDALKKKEQKANRATKTPKKVSLSEAKMTGAKPYFAKKQKKLQKAAKAIETRLEKLEKVEKPQQAPAIRMNASSQETLKNRIIMRFEDVEGHVPGRKLWNKTSFFVRGGDKLAVIGPNGSGKTTLVKKIVNEAEGIAISPAVKIGYFSQHLSIVDAHQSILDNVRSTSKQEEALIRTALARLRFFREDVHKLVGALSGGERVKVALAKILLSDANALILDEPTNYLDIQAVTALESLLKEYEGTIIFVSHDRRFIENIATRILAIDNNEVELFDGTYEQYRKKPTIKERDAKEEQLLVIETKISEILSRLSIEPSEALEEQFQRLVEEKKRLI